MATHDLELIKDLKIRRIRLDHGKLVHDSGIKHHKRVTEPEKPAEETPKEENIEKV